MQPTVPILKQPPLICSYPVLGQQAAPRQRGLPSEQGVPFGASGFEQAPLLGSQVPATWQSSEAEQATGVPAQPPAPSQWSSVVHASPSSHALVAGEGGF